MRKSKPTANKASFDLFVNQARSLGQRGCVTRNDLAFPEAELQTVQKLHERVMDLIEPFKIGGGVFGVLDRESRPADLDLTLNWDLFLLEGLEQRCQKYAPSNVYYARAFHELIGITVGTIDSFLGLMEAPVAMDFSPNMQIHGSDPKGKPVTWIARVKTTAEGYHHARFEYTAQAFLNKLRTAGSVSEVVSEQTREIHETMIQALGVMSAAVCVAKIYSDKKWVVCKD